MGELGDALRTAVEQVRTEAAAGRVAEPRLERARRLGPGKVNPWVRYHRIATAAAAAAVLLLTFGLLLVCWRFDPNGRPPSPLRAPTQPGPPATEMREGINDVVVGVDHGAGRPRPARRAASKALSLKRSATPSRRSR